jgi:Protein of unknown function (DUF1573)
MMLRVSAWVSSLLLCILGGTLGVLGQSPQSSQDKVFDFGALGVEDEWHHTFQFENSGSEPLEIKDVQLTPPLVVTSMTPRVQPGKSGIVNVRLEQPREKGEFQGTVAVNFRNQPSNPRVFEVVGKIVPLIEFDPFPMFFVSTQRGRDKTASIEIVNHEHETFEILRAEHASSRFTTQLTTLQPGRRYRLSLTLKTDGPAGRMDDMITLVTSSREHPSLKIQAHTNINERVHVFPGKIDLGTINIDYLKAHAQTVESLSTSLIVYQDAGKDFQISATTDVPFLELSTSQAQLKDRFEVRVKVIPEKLKSGEVNGTVVVVTNDPEFRRLAIPVRALIEVADRPAP